MRKVRWPLASMTAVICAAAVCFSLQGGKSRATAGDEKSAQDRGTVNESAADENDKPADKNASASKNKKARKKEVAPKKKSAKQTRRPSGVRPETGRGNATGGSLPATGSGAGSNGGVPERGAATSSGQSEPSASTQDGPAAGGNPGAGKSNVGGGGKDGPQLPGDAPYPKEVENVINIQNKHSPALLQQKGITGVSTALSKDGTVVIKVSVTGADDPKIPAKLDGIRVEKELRGQSFENYSGFAGSSQYDPQTRLKRPVPIGVSAFNLDNCGATCSTGTIGCRVRAKNGSVYALSNNHIFAANNLAPIGSLIAQPGPADNNCQCIPEDKVGTLFKFKQKDFNGGFNRMDAALMSTTEALTSNATLPDGYGVPRTYTIKRPQLGMKVMKYGRTTGFTKGRIVAINSFEIVLSATGDVGLYTGQIEITGTGGTFGAGGDSGSLIVDENRFPVGLLFAGAGQITIANRIQEVLDEFGVEIDGDDSLDFPIPGKSGRTQPDSK